MKNLNSKIVWLIFGVFVFLVFGIVEFYCYIWYKNFPSNSTTNVTSNTNAVSPIAPSSASSTKTATPSPSVTVSSTKATFQWKTYQSKEIGISFDFPSPSDAVTYSYTEYPERNSDPTGTFYSWRFEKPSDDNKISYYATIGGVSKDIQIGRETAPTDNYRWISESDKYYLERPLNTKMEVHPLKVEDYSSGTQSLILDKDNDPSLFAGMGEGTLLGYKLAILNFPKNYDTNKKIKSISFFFIDQTSTENIEKVLNSVKFD